MANIGLITRRFLKKYKYKNVDEMSLLHLSMLAGELNIDSAAIRRKHYDAHTDELTTEIKKLME